MTLLQVIRIVAMVVGGLAVICVLILLANYISEEFNDNTKLVYPNDVVRHRAKTFSKKTDIKVSNKEEVAWLLTIMSELTVQEAHQIRIAYRYLAGMD